MHRIWILVAGLLYAALGLVMIVREPSRWLPGCGFVLLGAVHVVWWRAQRRVRQPGRRESLLSSAALLGSLGAACVVGWLLLRRAAGG